MYTRVLLVMRVEAVRCLFFVCFYFTSPVVESSFVLVSATSQTTLKLVFRCHVSAACAALAWRGTLLLVIGQFGATVASPRMELVANQSINRLVDPCLSWLPCLWAVLKQACRWLSSGGDDCLRCRVADKVLC